MSCVCDKKLFLRVGVVRWFRRGLGGLARVVGLGWVDWSGNSFG
jgi:hypothetical protein